MKDKIIYFLYITEDGSMSSEVVVKETIEADILPKVGETIAIKRNVAMCESVVTEIIHTINEKLQTEICVYCKQLRCVIV